jgi:hypothetical protein
MPIAMRWVGWWPTWSPSASSTAGSDGARSLTDLGDQLRDEHPGGGRAWLDIDGAVGRGDLSALHLLDAVRTGQPAYIR